MRTDDVMVVGGGMVCAAGDAGFWFGFGLLVIEALVGIVARFDGMHFAEDALAAFVEGVGSRAVGC